MLLWWWRWWWWFSSLASHLAARPDAHQHAHLVCDTKWDQYGRYHHLQIFMPTGPPLISSGPATLSVTQTASSWFNTIIDTSMCCIHYLHEHIYHLVKVFLVYLLQVSTLRPGITTWSKCRGKSTRVALPATPSMSWTLVRQSYRWLRKVSCISSATSQTSVLLGWRLQWTCTSAPTYLTQLHGHHILSLLSFLHLHHPLHLHIGRMELILQFPALRHLLMAILQKQLLLPVTGLWH